MSSLIASPLPTEKKTRISRSNVVIAVFAILAIAGIGSTAYFYSQYQSSKSVLGQASSPQQEVKSVTDEVSKLIMLPQDEQPQIAIVSDVNKLKKQAFFSHAKNGDKVLIYTKAQKAILYDPVEKKIVEVGPINLASATPSVNPTMPEIRVALYNGTLTSGLTTAIQEELTRGMANVNVVSRGNAAKSTYTRSIVVDLTGNQNAAASQLADILGGQVGKLPVGEIAPQNADLLVILGKK